MFSGIVQEKAKVCYIEKSNDFMTYGISVSKMMLKKLYVGASLSNNGCCLTIVKIKDEKLYFNVINETLKNSNLNIINLGDYINIERSIRLGDDISGHIMTGHITTTAKINKISEYGNNKEIWISLKKSIKNYIFHKGLIGVDGISLTINNIRKSSFCINLIPETIKRTTIGQKKLGDIVNIEIDYLTQVIIDSCKNRLSILR